METVAQPPARGVGPIVVAFYAWASAVSFGLVVTDVGYARLLRDSVESAVAAPLFAQIADLLLLATVVVLLAAFGALVAAWSLKPARNAILAWFALGAAGVMVTAILPPSLTALGPGLRLLLSGSASVLAMLALLEMRHAR